MKFYKFLSIGLAAVMMAACAEEAPVYVPAEPIAESNPEIYFASTLPTAQSLDNSNVLTIEVHRAKTANAVTAELVLDGASNFNVPASVSFAAGQESTSIDLTYDYNTLDPGTKYEITIEVKGDDVTSPYRMAAYAFTGTKAWANLGVGQFFDSWVEILEDVTVMQSPDGSPRYRIMHPYDNIDVNDWGNWINHKPSDYIEFWVSDDEGHVKWNKWWLPGLNYQGDAASPIKAYLPSALSASLADSDANSMFVMPDVVQFVAYYYIDGLGGFGLQPSYLSMPGGPDLVELLGL